MKYGSKKKTLRYRKGLFMVLIAIIVSPVFGIFLADFLGYHEPLDIAAETLHLTDLTEPNNWTPFLCYTVPGLAAWFSYIVSGFIGVGVILGLGYVLRRLVK